MLTIREIFQRALPHLSQSASPRLDAQLLLSHVLGTGIAALIAYDDRLVSPGEQARFEALLERRTQGEPIAYILGSKAFYGLEFIVTPDVLIPRPETEHLVEAALGWSHDKTNRVAADIGTGSGAVAVAFASRVPHARVHAVDTSVEALAVARENARLHHTTITFHQGHLAQPLIDAGIIVDLLMANLPYIRSDELSALEVSRYEPALALDGGPDGLALIRELLAQVPQVCQEHALILLEIGAGQGAAVLALAHDILNPAGALVIRDYAGHDRVVRIAR